MAETKYTVIPASPQSIPQYEKYASEDVSLIENFDVNTLFDSEKNFVELHIYTLGNTLLSSQYNYSNYKILLDGASAGKEGSSAITVDPSEDALAAGFANGGVKLLYLFQNNLFSEFKTGQKLYLKEISPDRKELKLSSTSIPAEELKKYTSVVKSRLEDASFFSEFRLNFQNNDLFIGVNIDFLEEDETVNVKLYEPLPTTILLKSQLDIVEFVSNPLAYEIEAEFTPDAPNVPKLREANFNIELDDNTAVPSQYFNFDELFSYPVNNTNYQVLSLFNEKSAEISIDHSNYSDFIHFSSAEERLINFKYKLDLIKNYETNISSFDSTFNTSTNSAGVESSKEHFEKLTEGIVNNFDHYERFLYFESGSYSWPKSNTSKPYINLGSSEAEAISWFANQRTQANNFDVSNFNALTNTIPAFIREDENNSQYSLFINMLGQHFDNLYIYTKAVSDKYDSDNRINVGISRDLVEDAIKSLGLKLYNSSNSLKDLFKYFVGEYTSEEDEVINQNIQAGTVKEGETLVEGDNEGFSANYTNAFQAKHFPLLVDRSDVTSVPFTLYFNLPGSFSSGFNNIYYRNHRGNDLFITITDSSDNSYGPFRYTNAYLPGNTDPIFTTRPGTIDPGSHYNIYINSVDADGVDHSTLFTSLHQTLGIDLLIEDKRVTGGGLEVEPFDSLSEDIYQKSVYKRIYHNLPFLLKTKGTQRGLRALINCFGIPHNFIKIRTYGGSSENVLPFLANENSITEQVNKIRTSNTGSIVEGNTLSRYTSIVNQGIEVTDDLHNVEVGFSPTDNINKEILTNIASDFNIDQYIGDPNDLNSTSYTGLLKEIKSSLSTVTERYDVKDFVRLIKFFDNVVFKMIKDFTPARSTVDTGVIIKSHILERNKAKSPEVSVTQTEYSGSAVVGFPSGSSGGIFSAGVTGSNGGIKYVKTPGEYSTRRVGKFLKQRSTPVLRRAVKNFNNEYFDHGQDEAKFDGELANSKILITNRGELNDENELKKGNYPLVEYEILLLKEPPVNFCNLDDSTQRIVKSISNFSLPTSRVYLSIKPDLFNNTVPDGTKYFFNRTFSTSGVLNQGEEIPDGLIELTGEFGQQYAEGTVIAHDENLTSAGKDNSPSCAVSRNFIVVKCSIRVKSNPFSQVNSNNRYKSIDFFEGLNINTRFKIFKDSISDANEVSNINNISFTGEEGATVKLIAQDVEDTSCLAEHTMTLTNCSFSDNYRPVPEQYNDSGTQKFDLESTFSSDPASTTYYAILYEGPTALPIDSNVFNNLKDRFTTTERGPDLPGLSSATLAIQIPEDELKQVPVSKNLLYSYFFDITPNSLNSTPNLKVQFLAETLPGCRAYTQVEGVGIINVSRVKSITLNYSASNVCRVCDRYGDTNESVYYVIKQEPQGTSIPVDISLDDIITNNLKMYKQPTNYSGLPPIAPQVYDFSEAETGYYSDTENYGDYVKNSDNSNSHVYWANMDHEKTNPASKIIRSEGNIGQLLSCNTATVDKICENLEDDEDTSGVGSSDSN